jgi:translation initiation factor 4E
LFSVQVENPQSEEGGEVEEYIGPDLLVKHPLQNVWALWYFKNDKRNQWLDNQKVITTFSTVEDFWA